MTSSDPTEPLVQQAPVSVGGLWALLVVARDRLGQLTLLEHADEDLSLFESSMDLTEALGDLEWHLPDLPDLPDDDVPDLCLEPVQDVQDQAAVVRLLRRAVDNTIELLRDTAGMDRGEVLTLARVLHLIGAALVRLTGQLQ